MIISINGINIFYEVSGNGHPLIMLHGNSENHAIFDKVMEKLSKHYTVYAVDSRCHGQSGDAEFISYQLMADDMVSFIEALQLDKPYMYGFSDGAVVGILIAIQHRELLSKLAISGATTSVEGMKKKWRWFFKFSYFVRRDKLFQMVLTQPSISSDDLSKIKIPTLLLFGEKDITTSDDIAFQANAIANNTLKILPKEGHMSYVVHSTKLYPLLCDFFR